MRPAQLRRFAQPTPIRSKPTAAGFNEAGAAAPVCLSIKALIRRLIFRFNEAGAAAPVCLRFGRFACRGASLASMRPAQLRRFAKMFWNLSTSRLKASMRPAQLRRFATVESQNRVSKSFRFNEAGAAAPVCQFT